MPKTTIILNSKVVTRKRLKTKNHRKVTKSIEVDYDTTLERYILRIVDTEGMYPLLFVDREAGSYEIRKTRRGVLQMTK